MSKIIESASALLVWSSEIFLIKRQDYLKAFPGFLSLPGGKIDKDDFLNLEILNNYPMEKERVHLVNSVIRELSEELGIDILNIPFQMSYLGYSISPDYNPHRFKNHYYRFDFTHKPIFKIDAGEIAESYWQTPKYFLEKYKNAEFLTVIPTVSILEKLSENISYKEPIDFSYQLDHDREVPMIEFLGGIKQFMPLSNTFPPANRTNSFLIGDFLVDPSPKDEIELNKFIYTLKKNTQKIKGIVITHHHPDHHQFAAFIAKEFNCGLYLSKYTYDILLAKDPAYFTNIISITFLKEGEVLTTFQNENIYVYEIPGHDEGQIGLAPHSLKWFLVGDLIQTVGTVLIKEPEGDMRKYFASLKRVIDLKPKAIMPSHGIIIGGTHKLTETLEHRLLRETAIRKLHHENLSVDEMTDKIYPDLDSRLIPYAKMTIMAHLKKICTE